MLHRFHSLASDDVLISQSVKASVYLLNWHTAAVAEKRKSKMLSLTFLSNTWRRDMKENMWERFKFIGVRNLSMKSYEKSFFLLEVSIFHKVGESCAPNDQTWFPECWGADKMLLQCESSICNIKIDFVISVQIMTQRREAISKAQVGPEGSKLPKGEQGRNLTNDFGWVPVSYTLLRWVANQLLRDQFESD